MHFTWDSLSTQTPEKTSIEQLTESFISGLQANFPSTVNTIFRYTTVPLCATVHSYHVYCLSSRTGDKLSVRHDDQTSKPCALCQVKSQGVSIVQCSVAL